jgi:hypothetical protein
LQASPSNPIINAGTITLPYVSPGIIASTGTTLVDATISSGLVVNGTTLSALWQAGTISSIGSGLTNNSGTLSFNGAPSAGFVVSNGTILQTGTAGTGLAYSGGTLSLSPATTLSIGGVSPGSGLQVNGSGVLSINSPLAVSLGGTGLTSGTSGGILGFTGSGVATSSGVLTLNAIVLGGGVGATPAPLGTLGTTTTVLHGNASGAPTFGAVNLASDVTGNLSTSNLGGGTGASSSTFWRGDGTWATPPGTGTVTTIVAAGLLTGGTITTAGTIGLAAPSTGIVYSNGTTLSPATIGANLTLSAGGTLSASGGGLYAAGTGLTLNSSTFSLTSPVAVNLGGTGLTSGASGGILAFTAAGTITSSAALTQNAIVLGGGAGAVPIVLGSLGTTTTVLHGNASGAPSFGAVNLASDITGNLPTSNLAGGTGASSSTFWRGDGTWASPPGGVSAVTAGANLEVGSTPGGTITSTGTLNLISPAAGVVSTNGTSLEATTLSGLAWSGGTLSNSGVLQLGGLTGTIAAGTALSASGGTLSVTAATTSALGGMVVGSGLTVSSGTVSNSGILSLVGGSNVSIANSNTINALPSGSNTQIQFNNAGVFGASSSFLYFATPLTQPSAPTLATVGTAGSTSYFYRVNALNALGQSITGNTGTITSGNATLNSTNYINVTTPSITGSTSCDIYGGNASQIASGVLRFLGNTSCGSVVADQGQSNTGAQSYPSQVVDLSSGERVVGNESVTNFLQVGSSSNTQTAYPSTMIINSTFPGGSSRLPDFNGLAIVQTLPLTASTGAGSLAQSWGLNVQSTLPSGNAYNINAMEGISVALADNGSGQLNSGDGITVTTLTGASVGNSNGNILYAPITAVNAAIDVYSGIVSPVGVLSTAYAGATSGNTVAQMDIFRAGGNSGSAGQTVTQFDAFDVEQLAGSGGIANYAGLRIADNHTAGTSTSYAIHTLGGLAISLFEGPVWHGLSGTNAGTDVYYNANSGSITITPPTGALGSVTLTLPDTTGVLAVLPSATTSQLYGGSGTAGVGQDVTVGSGLSLSGGTLSATSGGGNVSSSGSPVSGQIALWNSGSTILGDTLGNGLVVASSTLNTNFPVESAKTAGFTFGTVDMGNTIPLNISGGGTITISSTNFGSTIFGAGQSACLVNITASGTNTLTNSSGATMYPAFASQYPGETICFQGDGTSLYASLNEAPIINVPRGGTGLATLVANTVYKGNGTSPLATTAITDNGSQVAIAEGALTTPVALTDASTIASNGALSNSFTVTLTASGHTLGNPTNTVAGQSLHYQITQPASGAPYSLAYGSNFLNPSGAALIVSLNPGNSAVTNIDCSVMVTNGAMQCYAPVSSAFTLSTPGNPIAPANTSTYFMQGLAGTITPQTSGNVRIEICGVVTQTSTTSGDGITVQVSYGTSTAPTNAAALTGTQTGNPVTSKAETTVTAANVARPFCAVGHAAGLTPGTAYWIDLAAKSVGTVSTTALTSLTVTAEEMR